MADNIHTALNWHVHATNLSVLLEAEDIPLSKMKLAEDNFPGNLKGLQPLLVYPAHQMVLFLSIYLR